MAAMHVHTSYGMAQSSTIFSSTPLQNLHHVSNFHLELHTSISTKPSPHRLPHHLYSTCCYRPGPSPPYTPSSPLKTKKHIPYLTWYTYFSKPTT